MTSTTRNQSPAVAKRKMIRAVMKRANAIAKNAYNAHNTSTKRIAQFGAATSMTEFLAEAMKIAWAEVKTGKTIYQNVGKLPRKTLPRIHAALAKKVVETNADKALSQEDRHYIQAKTMLVAKSAGEVSQEELDYAKSHAYNLASNETYALTA